MRTPPAGTWLSRGTHDEPSAGSSLVEAAALAAGEQHTAFPDFLSDALRELAQMVNDQQGDIPRQELVALIPHLVVMRREALRVDIAWRIADWVIRQATPRWLRATGLNDAAELLESRPTVSGADALPGLLHTCAAAAYEVSLLTRIRLDEAYTRGGITSHEEIAGASGFLRSRETTAMLALMPTVRGGVGDLSFEALGAFWPILSDVATLAASQAWLDLDRPTDERYEVTTSAILHELEPIISRSHDDALRLLWSVTLGW